MLSRFIALFFSAMLCENHQPTILVVQGEPVQMKMDEQTKEVKFTHGPDNSLHYQVSGPNGSTQGTYTDKFTQLSTPEGNIHVYAPTPQEIQQPTWTPAAQQPTWTPAAQQPTWTPTAQQPTWTPTAQQPTWTSAAPVAGTTTETPCGSKGSSGAVAGGAASTKAEKDEKVSKNDKKDKKDTKSGGAVGGSSSSNSSNKDKKNGARLYIAGATALISSLLIASL
ncbi:hypothetical protein NGRA_1112 [Nosema granulosis]|uniref:Uncharacterized protein n=1 Tax=Nosema granulosis TaxID=83296 RepID=A0A9P6H2B7_9MICR|nr:hypothetical protein NGRA_1112 [Nosema granulosis]